MGLVGLVDQQYQVGPGHLERLVGQARHFYRVLRLYQLGQQNLCDPWRRGYRVNRGSHVHLVDLVDQLGQDYHEHQGRHLCRLYREHQLCPVGLGDQRDHCHRMDLVDQRNLVDRAYRLDRGDHVDPFVPEVRSH